MVTESFLFRVKVFFFAVMEVVGFDRLLHTVTVRSSHLPFSVSARILYSRGTAFFVAVILPEALMDTPVFFGSLSLLIPVFSS